MNSQLFSFVECGHRMSKHVDVHIHPIAVVSEGCTKVLQWQSYSEYCTKLKVQMLQINIQY